MAFARTRLKRGKLSETSSDLLLCFSIFVLFHASGVAILLEGDIKIDGLEEDMDANATMEYNNAIVDRSLRWQDGVIPYKFGRAFEDDDEAQDLVETALKDLMAKTCVRFMPRKDEVNYLYFGRYKPGCFSYVARKGGRQLVNLDNGCLNLGTVQHEVMHALGFYHEQSRTDRDEYVTIMWDNIPGGKQNRNFAAERTDNLNLPYDYESVMHYAWNAFAIDRSLPTIIPKRNARLGNRKIVSNLDVEKINRLYDCKKPAPDPDICWTGNVASGCYFPGDDFVAIRVPRDDCENTCSQTQNCTHFTWTSSDVGICWLEGGSVTKSDAVAVNDVTMLCGLVKSVNPNTIEWKPKGWAYGCDFPGNDLLAVSVPAAQCGTQCVLHPNCTHLSWTTYQGGTCWLKQGGLTKEDAVKVSDKTVQCGVVNRRVAAPKVKEDRTNCTRRYTVKERETFWSIAHVVKRSWRHLVRANPQVVDPTDILPGQVICI